MILNEEQRFLQDTVSAFLTEQASTQQLRQLRAQPVNQAFDPQVWQALVDMGLTAMTVPEEHGGLSFGWLACGAVAEAMGQRLSATPFLSSVVLAQGLLVECGSSAQIERYLPGLLDGREVWAVAMNEGHSYNPDRWTDCSAQPRISVAKNLVMDGVQAHRLLVLTKREGADGLACLLVSPDTPGVQVIGQRLMDGRQYAEVVLTEVTGDAVEWLAGNNVAEGCQRVLDRATAVLAAEMMGSARALQEMTVKHLCEREQFDVKIGTFQALQHRAAHLYAEVELAQSAVQSALLALDRQQADVSAQSSCAKALAGDCLQLASDEAVQLHGGMGVTDEMDVGLFLKRSRVSNQLLGTAAWHRTRYAQLQGF